MATSRSGGVIEVGQVLAERELLTPAEFLIDTDGQVLARKYGVHAYDQWTVDELLVLAGRRRASHHPTKPTNAPPPTTP